MFYFCIVSPSLLYHCTEQKFCTSDLEYADHHMIQDNILSTSEVLHEDKCHLPIHSFFIRLNEVDWFLNMSVSAIQFKCPYVMVQRIGDQFVDFFLDHRRRAETQEHQ